MNEQDLQKQITKRIEKWHTTSTMSQSLSSYLEMTHKEYEEYVLHGNIPKNYEISTDD